MTDKSDKDVVTIDWKGGSYTGQVFEDRRDKRVRIGPGLRAISKVQPSGRGSWIHPDGREYHGELQKGLANGQGVAAFPDGSSYDGKFRGGKFGGKGRMTYPDGSYFDGEWSNGFKFYGTMVYDDSSKYVGQFEDDKRNGQGTLTHTDGSSYVGQFEDDKRNGKGTLTHTDGSSYVGQWRDGEKWEGAECDKDGDIVATYLDGFKRVGELSSGRMHGPGKLTHPDGREYVGEFNEGKKHGQGTESFPDGSKFVGQFWDGKWHGQGIFTHIGYSTYVGEWKNGQMDGQGTEIRDGDGKYVGEWLAGRRHGGGARTYSDGSQHIGEWKNDRKHGHGTFTDSVGTKYVGLWKKGDFFNGSIYDTNANLVAKYSEGIETKKLQNDRVNKSDKDLESLRVAAEGGDELAQTELGERYLHGVGVEQDIDKALSIFYKYAEAGFASAQYELGCCYYTFEHDVQDLEEAAKWFRIGAEQGHPDSQWLLGNCYSKGTGVEKNFDEATKWLKAAGDQGLPNFIEPKRLEIQISPVVEEQTFTIIGWLRFGVEQGSADAMDRLAGCYWTGDGVEDDQDQSLNWLLKAAHLGHQEAKWDVLVAIHSILTEEARIVLSEPELLEKHIRDFAEEGNPEAWNLLGRLYSGTHVGEQLGIEKDLEVAAEWFRRAAESGHYEAKYYLATCYQNGEGIEKNLDEAEKWFSAAKQGDTGAALKWLSGANKFPRGPSTSRYFFYQSMGNLAQHR